MDERPRLLAIALCAALAVRSARLSGGCLPSMALRTADLRKEMTRSYQEHETDFTNFPLAFPAFDSTTKCSVFTS